jgi:protein-S-isoprenylcysteine O-methyltransferase Ste14
MQQAQIGRWAVAAMFATNGFVMGAWAPQIPLLLTRHNISNTALGLLILALGLGAVGAMLRWPWCPRCRWWCWPRTSGCSPRRWR